MSRATLTPRASRRGWKKKLTSSSSRFTTTARGLILRRPGAHVSWLGWNARAVPHLLKRERETSRARARANRKLSGCALGHGKAQGVAARRIERNARWQRAHARLHSGRPPVSAPGPPGAPQMAFDGRQCRPKMSVTGTDCASAASHRSGRAQLKMLPHTPSTLTGNDRRVHPY